MTTMTTMTTTFTIPEPKYRRLDMAKLPPHRLEKLSQKERNGKYSFLDLFSPIQYKNIWDDETEAKRAEDEQKVEPITRQSQTKSRKMRRPFCKFCFHRRLPLSECKTHYTKSGPEFGSQIICPVLLQQQCARCGEIGHTPKYCKSEHRLNTDACEIGLPRVQTNFDNWFPFAFLGDKYLPQWQKPIPPAFQKRHKEYEETHVKTSRIWIEMTGDHKHYTNDFRLVMLIENEDECFDIRKRTEYENRVQAHWEMMRKVIWDDTPIRSSRDDFFIIRSPPPSYEQAVGAVKFLESVEATKAAREEAPTASEDNYSTEFDKGVWECEKAMKNIIGKYIKHQRLSK